MESKIKKRKIAEEKRKFNIQWTEKYFVTELCDNIICLICNDKIAVCKEYNIKRHYGSKHGSEYKKLSEEGRKTKIEDLTKSIRSQQASIKKHLVKTDTCTRVSYLIAETLAKTEKLFKQSVDHEILNNHCLIHQQQLCAQKLNMKHLMTDIVKVVNFIRSREFESSRIQSILGRSWK